ncbi:gliding motility-associated C-terminal domain-containing protein [Tamlana sp. 2_MG-2023]|uniref:PKD domain-containing protein n=1 Tax=unclassified Tamlana TaxID=2614803 RepID=UPI0026E21513|nr:MULTISPECIES: gliding motility-associated C-terminal domain-containing protein [unclassified Tamlana]MDO6760812.1 gliding motility-associated C-terminal domain-containing protein [Tamlana sp. 2_MG-2023]MDO6791068.1 gliding motility-associated C-terminal domain-containing protein [Tamlana sp. 1_MG-2023]
MQKNYFPKNFKSDINLIKLVFLTLSLFFSFTYTNAQSSCTVNAGTDQTICETDVFQLNGNAPDTYQQDPIWTQISGPSVIISDPTILDPIITGFSGGNSYTFELSAVCLNGVKPKQTVTYTVQPISQADAGIDIASCPDSSGSLVITGNTPATGEDGNWSIEGSNGAGVVVNQTNSASSTISLPEGSSGTTVLRWTITGPEYAPGEFCETYDEITITNYGGVEPVDAGPDQTLSNCFTVDESTQLDASYGGSNLNGQVGTWTFVSGPSTPNISDVNDNQTTVSGLSEGVYVFRWDVTGPCVTGSDTVTITVPAATQDVTEATTTNSNQHFCDLSVTEATLIGSTPDFTNETVLWELTSYSPSSPAPTPTIENPNSSTTKVTGLDSNYTYTFTYTIINNVTGCESSDTVSIHYNDETVSIEVNGGNDLNAVCGETQVDVPYSSTGGTKTEYSVISGPAGSSISFPTSYTNLGGASSGTETINDFDVPGAYKINFRRSTSGNLTQGCGVANSEITVFISKTASDASAGSNQAFLCGDTFGTLAGSPIEPGETSIWTQVSGPNTANIVDPYSQNTSLTGLVPGIYDFKYTVSGGAACTPDSTSDTKIFVSPSDNGTAEAGDPQIICTNTPVQLAGNTPNIVLTGTWTASDSSITFSDVNDPSATATGFSSPSTTYTLTWTIENTYVDCGAPAIDTVDIQTNTSESPTAADAGDDICLPSGTTSITSLDGNEPDTSGIIDETGMWTQLSGPSTVTFTDPTMATTEVTGLIDGQYEFQWEISKTTVVNPCSTPTTDTVEVVVADTASIVSAGPDQSLCLDPNDLSFTMAADPAPSGGVGTWVLISGLGSYSVDDINSPTATFTDLLDGTYVFEWDVSFGGCTTPAAPDQVQIEVGIPVTEAIITTSDQGICDTFITLEANPLTNSNTETGNWTVISGPNTPNIDDPSNNIINVTNLVTGSYIFRWTTVSGSQLCSNDSDEVTIDVYKALEAIDDQELCEVSSVFLEATAGTTGTWSLDSSTDPNAEAPTQSPSNSYTANANVVPGYTYEYSYTTDYTGTGNTCNSTETTTITVSDGPDITADAGSDQEICSANPNTTTIVLDSPNDINNTNVDTVTWSILSKPTDATVNFTSPNSLDTTVTGYITAGVYIFGLKLESGLCSSSSDVVRVDVYNEPSPVDAGPDQDLACQQNTQMAATAVTSGIGTWSFANPGDDPSGGAVVIDSPNNPVTTLSNIPNDAGNDGLDDVYILTWTVTSGVCTPQSDTVNITYTGTPPSVADAGLDQEYCDVSQFYLNASTPSDGIGTWTQTAGTTTNITAPNNPNSLVLGLTPGNYEFTWTVVGGGCTSVDSMEVIIYENPGAADAGPDQTLPEFSNVILGATPATIGSGEWTQISGPTNTTFVDAADPNTQVSGTTVGTYVFEWSISNGICTPVTDQVTIEILANSDLELTKTVTPSSVNVNDFVTFTIAVFNNNDESTNADATGVEVKDILPLGYTLVSGSVSNGGSYDLASQTVTWSNLDITNGATINLTFDATVNATGTYLNTAQITASDNFDPDSSPNNDDGDQSEDDEDQAEISLQSSDLSLEKTVSATTASVGDAVTFTITVSNAGPDEATNVQVSDELPVGYTYQSDDSAGNYNATSGIWNVGSVVSGTPEVLNITASVNAPSGTSNEYFNTSEVTASDQADPDSTPNNDDGDQSEDDEDNAEITLDVADLEVTKTISPTSGSVGDTVMFSVLVENQGTGNATGVDLEDALPSGFDLVPGTISNGGTYLLGSNAIAWSDLSIDNGLSITLTYEAIVNATGNYTNTVQITASDLSDPDSTPGNDDPSEDDQDSATFTINEADLELTKNISSASSATPNIGDTVTFELTLLNNGPDDTSTVAVQDILPAGYTLTPGTINNGGTLTGNNINWTNLSLVNGASITLSYDVVVNAPAGTTGEYTNTAQVTASNVVDPDSAPNNDDGDQSEDDETAFTITPQTADLSINKTVSDSTPNVGDVVTFTINLSNDGTVEATNVSVQDLLPIGYSAITNISGSGTATGNQIDWTGLTVPVGSNTVTLSFDTTVNAPTGATNEYLNTVEITASDQFDPDSDPNSGFNTDDYGDGIADDDEDTESITIQQADLSLVKSVNNTNPNVGDTVVYTIIVTNSGPNIATGVAVEDILPAGLTLTAVYNGGTQNANTANWTGLIIGANNGSRVLTYEATVNMPTGTIGEYTNVAQITASNLFDPDSDPTTDETIDEDGDGDGFDDDEDSVTISPNLADLSLTKTIVNNNITPLIGSQITFEIRLTNDGPQNATGVEVTDLVPSGYSYVSYSSTEGVYDDSNGLWTVGTVVNGTTEVLLIDVTVNQTGGYLNTAEVTASDVADSDSTPNNHIESEDDQDSIETTPVEPIADLSLTKSVANGNTTPLVGSQITFQIAVSNDGPQDATGVEVTDVLPNGFTYVSSVSSSGSYDETTGVWTTGTVINNGTETLSIIATVNATGNYVNVAEVSASNLTDSDSIPANDDGDQSEDDEDSVTITPVQLNADLALTKTVSTGNTSPLVGSQIGFQIAVTNDGPQNATGVEVTDILPAGYTYVSSITTSGTYDETTGLWNIGTINNSTTETLTMLVVVNASGPYLNTAEVTASDIADPDSTPNNGAPLEDDQDSAIVTPTQLSADLSLTKTIANGNTSPLVGDQITFQIAVTNDGPQNATGVEVTDLLPSGFTYVSSIMTSGTYDSTSGIWNTGMVNNGATETLSIIALVNATGNYENIAEVTASDIADPDSTPNNGDPSEDDQDNVIITPTPIEADLSLTKTVVDGNTSPLQGTVVRFLITVTNSGPQDATGVEVTDLLPSGYNFQTFSTSSGAYNPTSGIWTLGSVANGASETLLIDARIQSSGVYTNSAEITASNQFDPDSTPDNDLASEDDQDSITLTPVVAEADLSLVKEVVNNMTSPLVGSQVTFQITVTNDGPHPATGVEVTDLLPFGFSYDGFNATAGTYNSATGLWLVGPIANGNSQTLTIDATVNAPTGATDEYLNIAQVSASNINDPDSVPGNDDANEDDQDSVLLTPVAAAADLELTKTEVNGNTSPVVGTQITFEIVVTNNGPNFTTGVEVTDLLPQGFTFDSFSATAGTYNQATGLWTVGGILNGASQTLLIDAIVNAPTGTAGEYLNTAQVSASDVPDTDSTPGNDAPLEDDQDFVLITPIDIIADLSLSKTVVNNNTSPVVGEQITFEITLTNDGPNTATDVEVSDLLPSGFDYVSYSATSGTYTPSTGLWNVGIITDGDTQTLLVDAIVMPSTGTTDEYLNISEVTASDILDSDSTPGNNVPTEDDQDSILITPQPEISDLSLVKTVTNGNTSPLVGDQITFQITVTNDGPQDATGVEVTDLLPSGFDYISYSSTEGMYDVSTGIWSLGTIISGTTEILLVDVLVKQTGGFTNIAEVTASNMSDPDSTPGNNILSEDDQDSLTITPVQPSADLSLSKTVASGNTSPLVGSQIAFQIEVTNDGPQDATGVEITDLLPTGYTYVSSITSSGSYNDTTGIWNTGTVNSSATESLTVLVIVNATGGYLNTAEVTASDIADIDSTPGNGAPLEDDQDSAIVVPVQLNADLSLTKTVAGNNTTPLVGTEITFQIAVTNDGPQDATGVEVTDLLPDGFTYVSSIVSSGIYDETTGIWNTGTVINGATETLSVVALVNPTGNYTNIAEVTASDIADSDSTPANGDPAEDDQDSVTITPVTINADLSLTKTVAGNILSPLVGTEITFQIAVTNDGPQDATGVEVTDLLPDGFTYVSSIISSGTYDETTGIWNTGTVINGATETLSVVALVNPTGDYTNIAEVTASDIADSDSTPNNDDPAEDDQDSITITPVQTAADLSLTKTVVNGNTSPLAGTQITFQITVNNDGPQDATGVEVTDLLPSGFVFENFSISSGTYNASTGIWNLGTITNGASETLLIDARVQTSGVYLNTAEITASDIADVDSTPNNNIEAEDDQDSILITPVIAMADLSLTKEVVGGNTSPLIGTQITFQITVTNDGPNLATGVEVTDLLPAGFDYVVFNATAGTYNQATGLWSIGIIASGQSQTLLIDAKVNAPTGTPDEHLNIAEVTASDINDMDSIPDNDDGDQSEDDEDSVLITPADIIADLSLSKTVVNGNTSPIVGSMITFEIIVTNDGPNLATGVEVTDVLPTGFDYVLFSATSGTYNQATGLWTTGVIPSGSSQTLLIDARVNAPTGTADEFLNIAEVTASNMIDPDSTPNNDDGDQSEDDEDSVLITPTDIIADLSLSKTVVNNNINPNVGDQITFEITVSNDGPNATTGVEVTDLLPSGFAYTLYSSTSGTYSPSTGVWRVGVVASGSSQTLLIDATVNTPTGTTDEYFNIAEVTASDMRDPDSTPNNDDGDQSEDDEDAVLIMTETADLSLNKTVNNLNTNVDETVVFSLQINNAGASSATGVAVQDILPTGYRNISNISNGGIIINNIINWTNLDVPLSGLTLTFEATVNMPTLVDDEYLNVAQITASDQFDIDSTPNNDDGDQSEDDESSAMINVPTTDIEILKTVSADTPNIGDDIIFTISASNLGNIDATTVEISDILPSGYVFGSYTTTSGSYDPDSGSWLIPRVVAGTTETLNITVEVVDINDYVNMASLEFLDQIDSNDDNNTSEATITPSCLTIYNEFSPDGNGKNEFFHIDCIGNYPNNALEIYNRWGNLVYSVKAYNNTFNGESNGQSVFKNGEELPAGTYYYILDLGDGSERKAGWLYLAR